MKIVISCGTRTWGGLEHIAEVLARGLQQRGHDLALFCRWGSPLHQRLRDQMPCEPFLRGSAFHPLTVGRAVRALRRHQPDAVIGNTMKDPSWTGAAAHLLGIPYVYRHEFDVPYVDDLRDRLRFGRVPTRHVVNSEAVRRTLLSSVRWLDRGRVVVLRNGVDVGALERGEPAGLGVPEGATVFGYVGRFQEEKGIRELSEAWPWVVSAHPEAHLVIAGFGPLENEFHNWLEDVPNVHWLGFRRDIAAVMKSFDVLVAPSWSEGFGVVMVEAMAVGTPVLSTDTSAIPEIVTDGVEGLLVPVRDTRALADAMIRLAADPALRAEMGRAGPPRVRRDFTVERMIDQHVALLEEVVRERSGASGTRGGWVGYAEGRERLDPS